MDNYKWITINLADYEEYLYKANREKEIRKMELQLLIERSLEKRCRERFMKYTAQLKMIEEELKVLRTSQEQT